MSLKNQLKSLCFAIECYDEWESNDIVWDSNTMVRDAILYVVNCLSWLYHNHIFTQLTKLLIVKTIS